MGENSDDTFGKILSTNTVCVGKEKDITLVKFVMSDESWLEKEVDDTLGENSNSVDGLAGKGQLYYLGENS